MLGPGPVTIVTGPPEPGPAGGTVQVVLVTGSHDGTSKLNFKSSVTPTHGVEKKMNKSPCSSRDRLPELRAVAGFTPCYHVGRESSYYTFRLIKAESEDLVRGPAAKQRPAGDMLKL
jgi:hypothetical protein